MFLRSKTRLQRRTQTCDAFCLPSDGRPKNASLSPRPIRTGPSPSSLPTLRLAPSAGSLSPFPPSAGAPLLPPLALSSPFLPPWAGGPLLPPPALSVRAAASRPRGAGHGATAGERAALRGERAWELRRRVHGAAWGRSSASATEPRFTLAIVSGEELEGEAWHGTTRRRGAAPTGRKSVDSGRNRRRRGSALLGGGRKRAALVGRLGALLENEPFGYATLSSSVTQRNK